MPGASLVPPLRDRVESAFEFREPPFHRLEALRRGFTIAERERARIDVLALLRAEAMEEGQARGSGRVYNPSGTLDRILREHYADKLRRTK